MRLRLLGVVLLSGCFLCPHVEIPMADPVAPVCAPVGLVAERDCETRVLDMTEQGLRILASVLQLVAGGMGD